MEHVCEAGLGGTQMVKQLPGGACTVLWNSFCETESAWTISLIFPKASAQLADKYNLFSVPDEDRWRAPLLVKLLEQKSDMSMMKEQTKTIILYVYKCR